MERERTERSLNEKLNRIRDLRLEVKMEEEGILCEVNNMFSVGYSLESAIQEGIVRFTFPVPQGFYRSIRKKEKIKTRG